MPLSAKHSESTLTACRTNGMALASVAGVSCIVLLCGCLGQPAEPTPPDSRQSRQSFEEPNPSEPSKDETESDSGQDAIEACNVRFAQVQQRLGIDHIYQNGAAGRSLFVETIGGGCGWFDFDNDGWPDLILNQGGDPIAPSRGQQPHDAVFRNLLPDSWQFVEVSDRTRIKDQHYSQGLAVGDFNNDGFQDVYITNFGKNTLWQNCGDGTFIEVADVGRVADPRWSTSAAWGDLNGDGSLDLYVCNYCEYDALDPPECKDDKGRDTMCNPGSLLPQADSCYFSNGDGTFTNVITEGYHTNISDRGLGMSPGRGLGVAIADFDNDTHPDIYVANDTTDNFLFVGDGRGQFSEEAHLRGCAVDRAGTSQGSMGIAVGDYDRNGFLDIYSTHFVGESNTLYANFGDLGFRDVTAAEGLHATTFPYVGFGTVFADFDGDGNEELFVANGHVDHSARAEDPSMNPQLFTSLRSQVSGKTKCRWIPCGIVAGEYFQQSYVGRGVATADFDRDGDLDIVVANENSPAVLLENQSPPSEDRVIRIDLVGRHSNRSCIGSRLVALQDGSARIVRELCGGTSYAASHELRVLAQLKPGETLAVIWPGGEQENISLAKSNITLVEE